MPANFYHVGHPGRAKASRQFIEALLERSKAHFIVSKSEYLKLLSAEGYQLDEHYANQVSRISPVISRGLLTDLVLDGPFAYFLSRWFGATF